jgi:hypothetical protein
MKRLVQNKASLILKIFGLEIKHKNCLQGGYLKGCLQINQRGVYEGQGSISSNFGKKRMAKSHQQIAASQVAQIFSASTSPNFVQKCFVKWLFSSFCPSLKKVTHKYVDEFNARLL